jgi:hypothetical protein
MKRRLSRAKAKIKTALIFNEGYAGRVDLAGKGEVLGAVSSCS